MKTQEHTENAHEIERKFVLADKPKLIDDGAPVCIRQGYLDLKDEGGQVRVRQEGKQYFLTIQGATHSKEEVKIGRKAFRALWPLTKGRRVRLQRFRIAQGEWTVAIDIYRRKLKGLITAEVDFPDKKSAKGFSPPDWLGREVTGVESYRNHALAVNGIPEESESAQEPEKPSNGKQTR
jgi:CYTH domain-containing protein